MPLDTLASVKTRLNITSSADDALLSKLMDGADDWIRRYCDRDLDGGSFTEDLPGGTEFLCVRNYPIDSVASVRVDPARVFGTDTIVPASAYVVHAGRGVIQSVNGPFLPGAATGLVNADVRSWTRGPRVVRVAYATLAVVPEDVRTAYARLVGGWYRRVKTDAAAGFLNVSQQKIGESFVIYDNGPSGGIPPEVLGVLAPFRVPIV